MNARLKSLPNPQDPIKQADVTDQGAAITAATLRQLRDLPVPVGEAAAVNGIYAKVDKLLDDFAKLSAALRARDPGATQRAASAVDADSAAANAASNAYGLTVCDSS
jgi:hypothetical protein